jgi:hypothetical protein
MRLVQTALQQIGHGDQFDRPAGRCVLLAVGAVSIVHYEPASRQGIGHRTASATAAPDQGQPDGVVFGGVDVRNGHSRQGGSRGDSGSVSDELATRRYAFRRLTHRRHLST